MVRLVLNYVYGTLFCRDFLVQEYFFYSIQYALSGMPLCFGLKIQKLFLIIFDTHLSAVGQSWQKAIFNM
jgi:hypothetical protein